MTVPTFKEMVQARRELFIEQLLQVSCKLFVEQGYEKTTLTQIAAAMNLHKSTLYNYIKSKSDIIQMIIKNTIFRSSPSDISLFENQTDASMLEQLRLYINYELSNIDQYQDMYIFRNQLITQLNKADRIIMFEANEKAQNDINRFIQKGIEVGEFHPLVEMSFITFFITYMLTAWALRRWYLKRIYTLEHYTENLINTISLLLGVIPTGNIMKAPIYIQRGGK